MRIRPDITVSMLRREINFINEIKDGSKKIGEMHINRANFRKFEAEKHNFIKNLFARFWSGRLVSHLKKLDRFVVLTEKDREAWTELDNVEVIPNPSPFMPSQVSPLTEKRVIAVGRYSHEKVSTYCYGHGLRWRNNVLTGIWISMVTVIPLPMKNLWMS